MISDKKNFFVNLENYYTEEEIQIFFNIVEQIENENLNYRDSYALVKGMKPKDVSTCFGIALTNERPNAMKRLLSIGKAVNKDALIRLRNAFRDGTINEFFKDYKHGDFLYTELLIELDNKVLRECQKGVYIREVQYLDGEIESAIPDVKIYKKGLSKLEHK